jgi:predicted AAA+ superfamily ATPase
MINRIIENSIKDELFKGKAIIILGARQVGKSSLLIKMFSNRKDVVWIDGDIAETQIAFDTLNVSKAKLMLGDAKIIIIDEAQCILNIGSKLKVFTDHFKEIQLIASGSSSFDLANKVNEPLTGRKWEYLLFPLSFQEMANHQNMWEECKQLHKRMVFGYYPDVVCKESKAIDTLKELTTSYLYKDLLQWEGLKKSDKILKLLQAIAFQIGSQVSYSELGQICGLDYKTVEKYIILLEQAFVIFRLPSFSRNLRNELKFSKKIYFYDNGIRNALISNYNSLELRQDVGALWENFLMAERMKRNSYAKYYAQTYFWRTQTQKEIDLVEEYNGKLYAFEFKWNTKKISKIPSAFSSAYPHTEFQCITPENYWEFLMS